MSLEKLKMVEWLKEQGLVAAPITSIKERKAYIKREVVLIVARAFKHDTEQMENERKLVTVALNLKRQYENEKEI